MALDLLVGGVRSGKSSLAVRMASGWDRPVFFVATGEPGDEEMAARIDRHRAERPAGWTTIEAPLELADALLGVPAGAGVILDCLTLWVSNLLEHATDEEILERAAEAATIARRADRTVAITNEVGWGIIPVNALARRFEELLGRVNAIWAGAADRTLLVVAGRALLLSDPGDLA
jgi:adenosylcobinamide kinase/adenosylcobinamide-phosphate guanylyltransferase